ncbi:hypothetical protein [Paenibacillus xylanexedens]|uniref:hypothetical protein n=1 Tax=Paenibacillus xylanexedens TaxID=528191 RepID=UPI000A84FC4C|nr:hypothetical protein [Paenibacillus xylanexedens]
MKPFKYWSQRLSILFVLVIIVGCGTSNKGEITSKPQETITKEVSKESTKRCPGTLEWIDFLMIYNVTYFQNNEGTKEVPAEQIGDRVGEVSYMLNEHACADHVTENGDAAYLPIGTVIYELKGYKSHYRVVANNKVYEAKENPNAKTMGDLMDIEDKVEKVSLESGNDGSPIGDFPQEAASEFMNELLPLRYVGFDEVYKKSKHETGIFLRVHLQDGTSFRMVYYPKANAFSAGAFGTAKLQSLIVSQRKEIKAAAGL